MVSAAASDRSLRASSCASAGAAKTRPSPTRPRPANSPLFDIRVLPLIDEPYQSARSHRNQTTVRVSCHRAGCRGRAIAYGDSVVSTEGPLDFARGELRSALRAPVETTGHDSPGCRGQAMLYSRGKTGGNVMTRQALLIVG